MKRPAFTLIEIMIVIAIVLILAGAAVLQTSSVQNLLRFNGTFSKMVQMVQRARNLAFTENEEDTNFGVYIEGTAIVTGQQKMTIFADRDKDDIYDPAAGDISDEKLENATLAPEDMQVIGLNFQGPAFCTSYMTILFESESGNMKFYCNGPPAMTADTIDTSQSRSGQLQVELRHSAENRQKCFTVHVLSGIPQPQDCVILE